MKRMTSLFAVAVLTAAILLVAPAPAHANFTATGTFQYEDLPIDLNGFQSPHPARPCRFVDVRVIDNATQAILAQGATDANGYFSIPVTDSSVRNVAILALTQSTNVANLNFYVTQWNTTAIHAFQGIVVNSHDPNTNIDMGAATAHYRAGGEPFNLYDASFDASDCIGSMEGGVRPASYRIRYSLDVSNDTAYYSGGVVNIGGNFGYDDTILLHETGHAMCAMYGNWSDSSGGSHYFEDNAQDPRLSFGEAWPTFFSSNVRDWCIYENPHVYLNSTGDSTTGVISFSYSLEGNYSSIGQGAASEVGIQRAMWDLTDGDTTADDAPGVDDEIGYQMDRTFPELWSFVRTYLSQPPFSGTLTYEDFHDLWLANAVNPQPAELVDIEDLNHLIQYRTDEWESDNTFATAGTYHTFERIGLQWKSHHTTFPQSDEDWVKFQGLAGITYQVNTLTMRDGADTYVEIQNSAQAVVASNDNIGTPTPGEYNTFDQLRSTATYVPATTQDLWVRVKRSTAAPYGSLSKYGHWDLQIRPTVVPTTYPNITVNPLILINVTVEENAQTTSNLIINNTGTQDALLFDLVEPDPGNPWMTEAPTSGSVPAGQSTTVLLSYDATGLVAGTYKDTLEVHSNDPNGPLKNMIVTLTVTPASGDVPGSGLAGVTGLGACLPNPMQSSATIRFALGQAGVARLSVFDVQGREVRRLVDQEQSAGDHAAVWDGRDHAGRMMPSGAYFYRLESGGKAYTQRLVLSR